MTDGDSAKERYRNKTKRVSILKENYHIVEEYLERRQKDAKGDTYEPSPIDDSSENRILQESFLMLMGTNKFEDPVVDRIMLFAERNELSKEEAIEEIVCTVLDDRGRIEETFRKPRLFESKFW